MFVVGRYHAFKINTHVYIYIQIKTHADLLYIYMNVWYEITYIYIHNIKRYHICI